MLDMANAALVGAFTSLTSTASSVLASSIGNKISDAKSCLFFKNTNNSPTISYRDESATALAEPLEGVEAGAEVG